MIAWDPLYFVIIAPAFLFMLYAQWRISAAYNNWGRVQNSLGITGRRAAEQIIQQNGLTGLTLQEVPGELSDFYDPRTKTVNYSSAVADRPTVAALAIAAHELGHAQQDKDNSLLLGLRSGLVPIVQIGSGLGPILLIAGLMLNFSGLTWLGILFFSTGFLFALVTLPVEIDASGRAMKMLREGQLLVDNRETRGARAVLTAAALTYVASMLMALFQLLYYIALASSGSRRRG